MTVETVHENVPYGKTPTQKKPIRSLRFAKLLFFFDNEFAKKKHHGLTRKEGRCSSMIIQMSLHHSQSVLNIYADFGEHPTTFRP